MDEKERIKKAIKQIEKEVPKSKKLDYSSPLELLVATMLSAQCTDERVNTVSKKLFKRYKTAKDYAEAKPSELEDMIRSTGFYKSKAKNIISTAKKIERDFGGRVPCEMEELISLAGVARKTANIVLLGAFGKSEGIAVDSHVKRVSKRLGLTKQENADKIEKELKEKIEREDWAKVNHLLIDLGRAICKARRPRCPDCPLKELCPSAPVFSKDQYSE